MIEHHIHDHSGKRRAGPNNALLDAGHEPTKLTRSWRRSLSYWNLFIDLRSKLMDWFLYDRHLHHERVKMQTYYVIQSFCWSINAWLILVSYSPNFWNCFCWIQEAECAHLLREVSLELHIRHDRLQKYDH